MFEWRKQVVASATIHSLFNKKSQTLIASVLQNSLEDKLSVNIYVTPATQFEMECVVEVAKKNVIDDIIQRYDDMIVELDKVGFI